MEMHVSPEATHQTIAAGDLATRGSEQKHQEVNLEASERTAPTLAPTSYNAQERPTRKHLTGPPDVTPPQ